MGVTRRRIVGVGDGDGSWASETETDRGHPRGYSRNEVKVVGERPKMVLDKSLLYPPGLFRT